MKSTRSITTLFTGVLLFSLTSGCSAFRDDGSKIDETRGWSEAKLYQEASKEIKRFHFEEASELLESLDVRYPNSIHAQQGMLDLAYAYYKNQDTDLAIVTAERFIKTYPNHPNLDYAYYIRGVASYDRGYGFVAKILPPDSAKTDQANSLETFRYFSELVSRFPQSRYAPDARQRMAFIRNNVAKYEVVVANHYLEKQAYPAALNRAKAVLQNFQSSPSSKAALAVMVEAYAEMGMKDLATDSLAVLQQTYPESAFTARSYDRLVNGNRNVSSMRKMINKL